MRHNYYDMMLLQQVIAVSRNAHGPKCRGIIDITVWFCVVL